MRILSDTLRLIWGRWNDPGEYPSGAGGGPLPSRNYIEEIWGRVVVQFESQDLELMEAPELTHKVAQDYLADYPQAPLDSDDVRVTKWDVMQVNRDQAVLEPAAWEQR